MPKGSSRQINDAPGQIDARAPFEAALQAIAGTKIVSAGRTDVAACIAAATTVLAQASRSWSSCISPWAPLQRPTVG